MSKIAHLSSVHSRSDTRIFFKECRSLSAHGHLVSLVVADGKGDERREGIEIYDVGQVTGRIRRMILVSRRILHKAITLDADFYQLHDPELIPIGLQLKRLGKKVIFDSHEDVPIQLLCKPYLIPGSRKALSSAFAVFERHVCQKFDGIIAATPFIREKFLAINANTVNINNFPMLEEFADPTPWPEKRHEVCYIGGIASIRGIRELVRACEHLRSPARLNLAGTFSEQGVKSEVKAYPGWARVSAAGFLDRCGVREVLGRSMAGLVTLHPTPNYLDALPVKMFEYMAAGIPVIASNFPLWQKIIETNQCGLCVNPLDPKAIAAAIDYLITHPHIAQAMGQNGKQAVMDKYNWSLQASILTDFYEVIENEN